MASATNKQLEHKISNNEIDETVKTMSIFCRYSLYPPDNKLLNDPKTQDKQDKNDYKSLEFSSQIH